MPATKKDASRSDRGPGRRPAQADTSSGSPRQRTPPVAATQPRRVKAREAASRVRGLADVSDSLDGRRRLRRLARLVAKGSREVRGIAFIEGLLGECLDEAEHEAATRERWRTCEAVAWGLAWLARTRRAGGSAGGLLERLVKHARTATQQLRDGDTASAAFVVALARLFNDIEACRCLERDANAALVEELGRLVFTDGAVHVAGDPAGSAAIVERVERWSAVREVATAIGGPCPWDDETDDRWRRATVTALRLLGGQGRPLTGAGRLPACCSQRLLDAATAARGRAGRTATLVRDPRRRIEPAAAKRLLPRDFHSADAASSIIRTGWHRDAVRVLLDHRSTVPRLEIATHDRLLVDGPWAWRVSINGRPLEAEGPWSVTGFESDRKATFLEIAAPLAGGLQIARQVVVLVRDAVVLLADAITAATPPAGEVLACESGLSLGHGLEVEPAEETRDVVAYDTSMRMMALPLALPEWSAAPAPGSLAASAGSLLLRQESSGGRLYAPLWLDCHPARIGRPLTWRQLSVADTRRNLPRHQAAAFRVQAGLEQWLLYRTLDAARNRTVLGCNLSCEFLVGRVREDGVVSRTLEIE
ncbi:MAG: hypothetical protein EBS56_08215 [Planctomycetia bacterium]|nr:hypothetical protein [Planctomycetia bacterium]